jgi:hypothetical protein
MGEHNPPFCVVHKFAGIYNIYVTNKPKVLRIQCLCIKFVHLFAFMSLIDSALCSDNLKAKSRVAWT